MADFTAISKIGWRAKNMAMWKNISGLQRLPRDSYFLTLSGPCSYGHGSVIKNSEYDQVVLNERFCTPRQYVSIEGKDWESHGKNESITGPLWHFDDFKSAAFDIFEDRTRFSEYIKKSRGTYPGVVSADFMTGLNEYTADCMCVVCDGILRCQPKGRISLIIFNLIQRNLRAENLSKNKQLFHKVSSYRDQKGTRGDRLDNLFRKDFRNFKETDLSAYKSGNSELAQVAFVYET